MISIKEAIQIAKNYVREVYAESGEQISDIGLEEVNRSEDDRVWLITVGFTIPDKRRQEVALNENLGTLLGGLSTLTRQYKVVHIDAQTGEPLMMKMRQINES